MSSKKNKIALEVRDASPNREKLYKRFKKLNGAYGAEIDKINTRSQKNFFQEKVATRYGKKHRSS